VGLQLLRDLVASAGGELHVRSAPGNGTDVTLELAAGNA
jgi:signal transduction histidine kinase